MAIERVRECFEKLGIAGRIVEYPVSSATVPLAAAAAGAVPGRIAKSLAFSVGDGCVLVVVSGDARIDNAKFKTAFATKARMLSAEDTLATVGHAVGGVCPFATNAGVAIFLDVSMRRYPTVFPACGSDNSAIELTLEELEKISAAKGWVDVCKNWERGELDEKLTAS